jgi:hypothetical protein
MAESLPVSGQLYWRCGRRKGVQVSDVQAGQYVLTSNTGFWRAEYLPRSGSRPKTLAGGVGVPESQAKALCRTHYLEELANARLINAGASDLVKPSLAGAATAFRRGGR